MAELFATSKQNIGLHIANILKEKELLADSTVKDCLTVTENNKQYNITFYALYMILTIGFRVRSTRGTEFSKWANTHLKQYLIKGFVMDDERLKNPDGRAGYFDKLLEHTNHSKALIDTFQMSEGDGQLEEIFPKNSERVKRQKKLPIRVIMGNPPYSVDQR